MASKKCTVCGKKIGAFAEWQMSRQGCICMDCYNTARRYRSDIADLNGKEVADAISKAQVNDQLVSDFHDTFHIGNKLSGYVAVFDDDNRRVMLPRKISIHFDEQSFWVFPYDDVVSAELMRNEQVVRASSLARMVVGGALLGAKGAAMGYASAQDKRANPGSESVEVNVRVRNYPTSFYRVTLLDKGLKETDARIEGALTQAVELVEKLNEIAGYRNPDDALPPTVVQATSDADELRKFKALLDDGIITTEEFEAKKAQLLGL